MTAITPKLCAFSLVLNMQCAYVAAHQIVILKKKT